MADGTHHADLDPRRRDQRIPVGGHDAAGPVMNRMTHFVALLAALLLFAVPG
jgi:hypothetical protein